MRQGSVDLYYNTVMYQFAASAKVAISTNSVLNSDELDVESVVAFTCWFHSLIGWLR